VGLRGHRAFADAHDEVRRIGDVGRPPHDAPFDAAGTYFPAVRAECERDGDLTATTGRVENLDRVRVVVT